MKTLIFKLGALGDVVRTTCLLNGLNGEIDWLSKSNAVDLLNSRNISKRYCFDKVGDLENLASEEYDLILSLDEEVEVLKKINTIKHKSLIGVYLNKERIMYTPEMEYWYNMSKISHFGISVANELKKNNKMSVPEILYRAIGKEFLGEEYDIGIKPTNGLKNRIGLIDVETGMWPTKLWTKFGEFSDLLKQSGLVPYSLKIRETIKEHISDINSCEAVVCGDTLGMHIALALKKPIVSLFMCTPEAEIETYGRMEKIVSPFCGEYLYSKYYHYNVANSISVNRVYSSLIKILKKNENKSNW